MKLNSLGLDPSKTKDLADQLNDSLANFQIYYQNLRGIHWNIKGKNFFDLHVKFEELYTDANAKVEQRKIAKIKLKNEKKEVIKKKVKDIFSINKSDKKTNIKKKEIVSKKNNVDIVSKKISCKELTDCTFDEISNSIKEKADNKDYPDITSK